MAHMTTKDTEQYGLLLPSSPPPTTLISRPGTMESSPKSFSTQRTFDSNDDLLADGEEEEEEEVDVEETQGDGGGRARRQARNELQSSPVWDCRALQWPPRSLKELFVAVGDYAKSIHLILEVAFLGVFVLVCYILPDVLIPAHHRPIPVQIAADGEAFIDLTFANEYQPHETVPGYLLAILCVAVPIVLFALVGVLLGPREDFHAALCSYLLAMALKIFVVDSIKNYVGYLRPSFYNMCQFNPDTLVCDDETTAARESFPSGHAATALSSMTLVALFLLGKVRGGTRQRGVVLSRSEDSSSDHDDDLIWTPSVISKLLALCAMSPELLGMFIAASRVRDNWHHPADVLCGGVIGVGCALFAHSLWYPSVYGPYAGIPLLTVEQIVEARKQLNSRAQG